MRYLRSILIIIAILIVVPVIMAAQNRSRITIASGVILRDAPKTSGKEITKLSFGTTVNEKEVSQTKDKIGNKEDYWYHVSLADGKDGWVFGGLTVPFDANRREEIYEKIVKDKLTQA